MPWDVLGIESEVVGTLLALVDKVELMLLTGGTDEELVICGCDTVTRDVSESPPDGVNGGTVQFPGPGLHPKSFSWPATGLLQTEHLLTMMTVPLAIKCTNACP